MNSTITSNDSIMSQGSHGHTRPKTVSISPELVNSATKITEVVGYTFGPALIAFNVFNFNIAKLGFYYMDVARFGLAAGVFLLASAIYISKQKK